MKIEKMTIKNMDVIKVKFPKGYEYSGVDFDGNLIMTRKKPTYPKTYEECCRVSGMTYDYPDIRMVSLNESELYLHLILLIRCRDAYWKIAGEEMGLGKPWEPKSTEMSHAIVCRDDGDFLLHRRTRAILIFPTEEMRDAFYENFKELIESCKELL